MSVHTTNTTPFLNGIFQSLAAFSKSLGKMLLVNRSLDARMANIEQLHSKSDAELRQLGLRRDQIELSVFRDLFYT